MGLFSVHPLPPSPFGIGTVRHIKLQNRPSLHCDYPMDSKSFARLLLRPLHSSSYQTFLATPQCLGAIVNHSNVHWTAIVKHGDLVWHVNSQTWPAILTSQAFEELLQRCPMTFVIVANDFQEQPNP